LASVLIGSELELRIETQTKQTARRASSLWYLLRVNCVSLLHRCINSAQFAFTLASSQTVAVSPDDTKELTAKPVDAVLGDFGLLVVEWMLFEGQKVDSKIQL